jgi:hypothetical protein
MVRRLKHFPRTAADFIGSAQGHFLLSEDAGKQGFSGKGMDVPLHAATNVAATSVTGNITTPDITIYTPQLSKFLDRLSLGGIILCVVIAGDSKGYRRDKLYPY